DRSGNRRRSRARSRLAATRDPREHGGAGPFLNDVFVNTAPNANPLANYQLRTLRAGFDFGISVKRLGELRLGLTYADFVDKPNPSCRAILSSAARAPAISFRR